MSNSILEWYDPRITINMDEVNCIEYTRCVDENYDEDEEGNPVSETLYNVSFFDSETNLIKELDGLSEEDLFDLIDDETIVNEIINSKTDKGYLDDIMNTTPDEPDDVESVNKVAKRVWKNIEYHADARGYILTDGSMIYFGPNVDHMSICWIDGMTVGRFVQLGNIRCGENTFQLEKEPTVAQRKVLRELIANHSGDELYFDITKYDGKGTYADAVCSCCFRTHNPRIVLNQIDRYFATGIKPDSDYYDEDDY